LLQESIGSFIIGPVFKSCVRISVCICGVREKNEPNSPSCSRSTPHSNLISCNGTSWLDRDANAIVLEVTYLQTKLHRYRKRARTPSVMHPMKVPVHKIQSCFTVLEERHFRMCISEKHAMSQYDPHCNFRWHIGTSQPLSDNVSRGRSLSKRQEVAKGVSDSIRTQFTYSVWAYVTSDSVYTTSCKDSSHSKWHWSMVLCQLPLFPLLTVNPPLLHIRLSHGDSPDRAVHYHILDI
jgi:hypothetical protein